MRRFFVAVVVCLGLCAASTASAAQPLLVKGAGASAVSGRVVVDARATGPITDLVAPAVGSFGVTDSFWGDLGGSVTCIAVLSGAVIVSGNLDTPVVVGGFSYANFSLIVARRGVGPHADEWIHLFIENLPLGIATCGEPLYFAAGIPDLPNDFVVDGHFNVHGL